MGRRWMGLPGPALQDHHIQLYGKALTTPTTTIVDYATAILGGHTGTKTMGTLPLDVGRLKGAFHATLLLTVLL